MRFMPRCWNSSRGRAPGRRRCASGCWRPCRRPARRRPPALLPRRPRSFPRRRLRLPGCPSRCSWRSTRSSRARARRRRGGCTRRCSASAPSWTWFLLGAGGRSSSGRGLRRWWPAPRPPCWGTAWRCRGTAPSHSACARAMLARALLSSATWCWSSHRGCPCRGSARHPATSPSSASPRTPPSRQPAARAPTRLPSPCRWAPSSTARPRPLSRLSSWRSRPWSAACSSASRARAGVSPTAASTGSAPTMGSRPSAAERAWQHPLSRRSEP
mmetsp:Transcript_112033/g.327634  ORF Transcript_112033/g.327634 Transcript_112033/m.327634 type:complete len:271 (-) Transcript_112033:55-867(-)